MEAAKSQLAIFLLADSGCRSWLHGVALQTTVHAL
jgi:hypothetical protein